MRKFGKSPKFAQMPNDSRHPLRLWREEKKLTLAALSDRLGEPPIPISTLHYYELGRRMPKPANMERIRLATGVTPDQFYQFQQVSA